MRDGNRWIVNGTKTFISYVEGADFVILFTTSNPKAGARGITCFLVEKGTPGFRVAREIPTMGDNWHFWTEPRCGAVPVRRCQHCRSS